MTDQPSARGCPICRATRCERLHRQRFALPTGHPLQDGYDLVHCPMCGFCYADTTVTQADYDDYYTRLSKYADVATGTGGGDSPWDAERLSVTADAIAEFIADGDARIVDIGCANGGLLKALKDRGYRDLFGIDPAPACTTRTTAATGVAAAAGSLAHLPDDVGKFAGVLLSHVMEHVSDLRAAVSAMGELLTPSGIVYIEVPDASRYRDYIAAPLQDINTEHINHFSLAALGNLMRAGGFELISGGSKTFASPPPYLYPAIFGFFRRTGAPVALEITRDDRAISLMQDYLERSKSLLSAMDQRLRTELAGVPEVAIWGYGQLAMKLLADSCLAEKRVAAIIDGNPMYHGQSVRGVKVVPPAAAAEFSAPILITSTLHHASIAAAIRERLPNRIISLSA